MKGLWHYARGIAFTAKGDSKQAGQEADKIQALVNNADFSQLTEAGIPAKEVLQIANEVVSARIAQANADFANSAQHFRKAIAIEDGLAYMEPSYWYYPIRQSLGAVLFQQGDLDGALKLIDESVINKIAFVGSPEQVRARIKDYEAVGVTLGIIRNITDRKTGNQTVLDNIEAVAPLLEHPAKRAAAS